jgi:hypothetical protein
MGYALPSRAVDLTFAPLVVIVIALAGLWLAARRQITVCVAEVMDGQVHVTQGGLAPGILSDVTDVVARPRVSRATLRIVRARGLAELTVNGSVSAAQVQQLRNVIGSVPLARLINRRMRS